MGGHFSKEDKPSHFNAEEEAFVRNTFNILSQDKELLRPEELTEAWSYLADPEFVQHVRDSCFRKSNYAPIKIKPFAKHFYIVVKGNVAEKAFYIATKMFDKRVERPSGLVITNKLLDFVTSTVRSYFMMLNHLKPADYSSWTANGVNISPDDASKYSLYVSGEVMHCPKLTTGHIERWLYRHPLFIQIWREVVIYLYSHMNTRTPPAIATPKTLPFCSIPGHYGPISSMLSIGKIMFINDCLPTQCRVMWTPIFNSKLHGESFSNLITKITHKGPTVLVIKDECGYEFGGFAPYSWVLGPKFTGDLTTTLFTLKPKIDRFLSSGHNNHFQYLNTNQQTMPNGLGMGGQVGYWGLWLDDSFSTGHSSETCSTFSDYKPMSAQKVFKLRHLEVWSLGEHSISDDDRHETILSHGTERLLLELAGHEFHSDAMRERNSIIQRN